MASADDFVAALLLTPALAFAQAPATAAAPNAITHPAQKTIGKPATRQYSTALIVINSRAAKLDGQGRNGEDRIVAVSTDSYAAFDHGYATTIHKTQGATVDRSFEARDVLCAG